MHPSSVHFMYLFHYTQATWIHLLCTFSFFYFFIFLFYSALSLSLSLSRSLSLSLTHTHTHTLSIYLSIYLSVSLCLSHSTLSLLSSETYIIEFPIHQYFACAALLFTTVKVEPFNLYSPKSSLLYFLRKVFIRYINAMIILSRIIIRNII
jgi:hypothetical protein